MHHAGFVLVGGKSSRMHRDKALLPWDGITLAQHVAHIVAAVAGPVTMIGDPALYENLGHPVIADRTPGNGPISGIETALRNCQADWALIVACDMPAISTAALRTLLDETNSAGCQCVVPMGPAGPEPLCAVYHRGCLPALDQAIAASRFRMKDVVTALSPRFITGIDPACFANLNTPAEVEAFSTR